VSRRVCPNYASGWFQATSKQLRVLRYHPLIRECTVVPDPSSQSPHEIAAQAAIRQAEKAVADTNSEPFSPQAFQALQKIVARFISELVEQSVRVSKRHRADSVAESHVESAASYLVGDAPTRIIRHFGTVGGILLGAGLYNLLAMLTTKVLSGAVGCRHRCARHCGSISGCPPHCPRLIQAPARGFVRQMPPTLAARCATRCAVLSGKSGATALNLHGKSAQRRSPSHTQNHFAVPKKPLTSRTAAHQLPSTCVLS